MKIHTFKTTPAIKNITIEALNDNEILFEAERTLFSDEIDITIRVKSIKVVQELKEVIVDKQQYKLF